MSDRKTDLLPHIAKNKLVRVAAGAALVAGAAGLAAREVGQVLPKVETVKGNYQPSVLENYLDGLLEVKSKGDKANLMSVVGLSKDMIEGKKSLASYEKSLSITIDYMDADSGNETTVGLIFNHDGYEIYCGAVNEMSSFYLALPPGINEKITKRESGNDYVDLSKSEMQEVISVLQENTSNLDKENIKVASLGLDYKPIALDTNSVVGKVIKENTNLNDYFWKGSRTIQLAGDGIHMQEIWELGNANSFLGDLINNDNRDYLFNGGDYNDVIYPVVASYGTAQLVSDLDRAVRMPRK